METTELFCPQIAVRAGAYRFDQGVEVEVHSSRTAYFDWAKIRFTEQFQPRISLDRMDAAAIEMGYNGVLDEVFTGYVAKPDSGGASANEIVLKDEMLLLEQTSINATFLDTTPQEVLAYILGQAGIGRMDLSSQSYRSRSTGRPASRPSTRSTQPGASRRPSSSRAACSTGAHHRRRRRYTPLSMASISWHSAAQAASGSWRPSPCLSSSTPTRSSSLTRSSAARSRYLR